MIKTPEIPKGDENFWEWNPQYIEVFEDFYKKDKSKNKTRSSGIKWAFYNKLHPDSVYYNMSNKEDWIKNKILKDPKFKWEKYENEENLFKETILTQAERSLEEWNETMRKRNAFLRDQDFTFDYYNDDSKLVKGNAKELDSMLANTSKLYQEYGKILKDLKEERMKRGKGDKPLSSSAANRI